MTHWGVIVREMMTTNRFPNFTTTEVAYISYPTGTASWVYYFYCICGYSEAMTLVAQGIMILTCAMTFFALNRNREKITDIITCLFFLFAINYNITLDGLKVDNILALYTIATILIIIYYWEEPIKTAMFTLPLFLLLSIIKNSGILFALFASSVALYQLWMTARRNKR